MKQTNGIDGHVWMVRRLLLGHGLRGVAKGLQKTLTWARVCPLVRPAVRARLRAGGHRQLLVTRRHRLVRRRLLGQDHGHVPPRRRAAGRGKTITRSEEVFDKPCVGGGRFDSACSSAHLHVRRTPMYPRIVLFHIVGFPPLCAGIETNVWSRSLLCKELFVKGQTGFRQSNKLKVACPLSKSWILGCPHALRVHMGRGVRAEN